MGEGAVRSPPLPPDWRQRLRRDVWISGGIIAASVAFGGLCEAITAMRHGAEWVSLHRGAKSALICGLVLLVASFLMENKRDD